jgi:transcription antitermination protein NusB
MKRNADERHLARRVALTTLFCAQSSEETSIEECEKSSLDNLDLKTGEWDQQLAENIIQGVLQNLTDINKTIKTCAPQWPLDKIFKIDLTILRMALFELLFSDDIPSRVAIDEAVELAKDFGNDTSSKFVNGVLGTVLEQEKAKDSGVKEKNN